VNALSSLEICSILNCYLLLTDWQTYDIYVILRYLEYILKKVRIDTEYYSVSILTSLIKIHQQQPLTDEQTVVKMA